jgi:hypothetical protein
MMTCLMGEVYWGGWSTLTTQTHDTPMIKVFGNDQSRTATPRTMVKLKTTQQYQTTMSFVMCVDVGVCVDVDVVIGCER